MTRKAIIIGNNTGHGASKFLAGVTLDLQNYRDYLISAGGGSWNFTTLGNTEVKILENANRATILAEIRNCNADYSFVVFTGHGYMKSKDELTYICVADGEISEDELRTASSKQSLILDCCREKEFVVENKAYVNAAGKTSRQLFTINESAKMFTLKNSYDNGTFDLNKSKSLEKNIRGTTSGRIITNARNKFDNALIWTSAGIFKGYACSVDETSGDNPTAGGIFSTAFINEGKKFSNVDNSSAETLAIRDAFIRTQTTLELDPLNLQKPAFITDPRGMIFTAPYAITNISNRGW